MYTEAFYDLLYKKSPLSQINCKWKLASSEFDGPGGLVDLMSIRGYSKLSFKDRVNIRQYLYHVKLEDLRNPWVPFQDMLISEGAKKILQSKAKCWWGKTGMAIFKVVPWPLNSYLHENASVGTHKSHLYIHTHFMLFPFSLRQKPSRFLLAVQTCYFRLV